MAQQALEPHRSRIPRFLRPPSTRLGWAATAGSVGAILLVIVVNLFSVEGSGPPEGNPWWWQLFGASALLCMAASGVAGLIAVVRKHERSWMVIVPGALVLLVAVGEMLQGLLYFLG
jgi:ABC-type multidrug transport system permease subunit